MAAATKSICKKLDNDNYDKLSRYCPAEAKSWREAKRKKRTKECEGYSYTSKEELAACLDGRSYTSGGPEEDTSRADGAKAVPALGGDKPAAAVLEGAKKLKGMFGF